MCLSLQRERTIEIKQQLPHMLQVPMVLELALGNVDQGQVTTASRATEGSTLLKLAEAKDDIATEVRSA